MGVAQLNSKKYDGLRVLFIGHGGIGSNALSLYNGIQRIVGDSTILNTQFFDTPGRLSLRRVILFLFPRFYSLLASNVVSVLVRAKVRNVQPNIIFVFKGNYLKRSTLESQQAIKVHFHPDDSSNQINRTSIFNSAESSYDFHFTPKKHNVQEIFNRTGKPGIFIWYAYDENWHFRTSSLDFVNPEFSIGFVGHMRPDRSELVLDISRKFGKKFAIAGLKWKRNRELAHHASVFPPVYGEHFSMFIESAPIQLGLLNSDNRDQHTARSFEIPASGGLIIAEDTPEHREMFGSSCNALFFKNQDELLDKIYWAINNPQNAAKIAENGYAHITKNGNTWTDRADEMLSFILTKVTI